MFFNPKELLKFKIRRTERESIEPDEILLDSEKIAAAEKELEGKLEVLIARRNFLIFFGFVLGAGLIFGGWLFDLQAVRGGYFKEKAEANKTRVQKIPPLRGVVYGADLKPLVSNAPVIDAVVSKKDLPKSENEYRGVLKKLSEILAVGETELSDKISNGGETNEVLLAQNIDSETYLKLAARTEELPGVIIYKNFTREYPFGPAFSHILGYVGKAGGEDLRNCSDCGPADVMGKSGLESFYDDVLRGKPGRKEFSRDSKGTIIGETAEIAPENGSDLILTVNSEFQKSASAKMAAALKNFGFAKGALIAVNPSNGDILALVSFPEFDPNLFTTKIIGTDFSGLFNNPDRPLFNRAVSGAYPIGSTIKPFIGAAALEEKIMTPDYKIFDEGQIVVPNPYDPGKPSVFKDWKAHGWVSLREAIAESCDVYFYTVGGGFGDFKGLGVERIKEYLLKFGFGENTGVDLFGAAAGLVPDPEWKKSANRYDSVWRIGDTYHMSIGQGDVLATPLQLAAAVASLANNGTLYKPRLVKEISVRRPADGSASGGKTGEETKKIAPEILRQDIIGSENLKIIREGMRMTVTSGSARQLANLPFAVAGKTGTAQFGNQGKTHAWFTGFAPYENPEIALVVLVEAGGEGSSTAVPIAGEVFRAFFAR